VTKKFSLLVMLAAGIAIVSEAQSQNSGAPAAPEKGTTSPAAEKSLPLLEKTPPVTSPAPAKASEAPAAKTAPPASPPATKSAGATPAGKDAASGKAFPTSSATATSNAGAASDRKELVIPRGLVTLIDDNKVPATEPGMLTKIDVKEGHSVENGELLCEIDSRSTIARRRIAEAELFAATATAENEAEIEVARAAILVSKAELEQSDEIRKVNPRAVSDSQYRKDKFTYDKSLAQEKQAINEKKIAGLTANAKQAQYDAASIELDLRQIRAPFKGQVVEMMKHVGDWVTAGEPIMHIVGLDRLRVKGFVLVSGDNGASADEVIGKPVTITVDAPGGKQHTVKGLVGFASPVIEGVGTSRQFRIWAEVDNEKFVDPATGIELWKIQPGSMAKMTIDLTPKRAALKPVISTEKSTKSKSRER
jgi:multidrug efflux pump subunit AcrA (membrane-fusion protein)